MREDLGEVPANTIRTAKPSIYPALVRLAQDFNMRYRSIDGQGNFGSVDGDPPAAMRYTEARLAKITEEMLADIEKETVDFIPNFDQTRERAGRSAHAHSESAGQRRDRHRRRHGHEYPAAQLARNRRSRDSADRKAGHDAERSDEDRARPGFPDRRLHLRPRRNRAAYKTGRGSFQMRAKAAIEAAGKDRENIVITEIPYQVNKARLIEHIAELVQNKKIEGISDVRDETDREGMRIVIEMKRGEEPQIILNNLFKLTQMQESFGMILLAIVGGPAARTRA